MSNSYSSAFTFSCFGLTSLNTTQYSKTALTKHNNPYPALLIAFIKAIFLDDYLIEIQIYTQISEENNYCNLPILLNAINLLIYLEFCSNLRLLLRSDSIAI